MRESEKGEGRKEGRWAIEQLITEGNQVFRYYQQCLRDTLEEFEAYR